MLLPLQLNNLLPPLSGAITGTAALTFTASGTLTGDGALSGSSALTFTPAGTLTGTGALTGSSSVTFTAAGSLSGLGSLTGSSSITFTPAGTLLGTGALTGAGTVTFTPAGTLTNGTSGALSGTAALTFTPAGTLTGSGALTGSSSITFTPAATLTGTGGIPSKAKGGGRRKKRRRYVVEIDGEFFDVNNQAEAQALLEQVREVAEEAVEKDVPIKPVKIKVKTGTGKESRNSNILSMVRSTRLAVDSAIEQQTIRWERTKAVNLEIAELLQRKIEQEDQDEEEALIALLLV